MDFKLILFYSMLFLLLFYQPLFPEHCKFTHAYSEKTTGTKVLLHRHIMHVWQSEPDNESVKLLSKISNRVSSNIYYIWNIL